MENRTLFITHFLASTYMLGVIWIIQIIHYPLFLFVGKDSFIAYELEHINKTAVVIALPMLIEFSTYMAMLYFNLSLRKNPLFLVSGLLLIIIWGTTFFVSVPLHNQLSMGYDQKSVESLIHTNWIRTIAWSLRVGILSSFI